jgi:hypothetical protein
MDEKNWTCPVCCCNGGFWIVLCSTGMMLRCLHCWRDTRWSGQHEDGYRLTVVPDPLLTRYWV